jgi:hypothetical protein
MGKLLQFPSSKPPASPPRLQLVEEAALIALDAVKVAFDEHEFEPNCWGVWHYDVRTYFWRQEIKYESGNFLDNDIKRWQNFWRNQALECVRSNRVQ